MASIGAKVDVNKVAVEVNVSTRNGKSESSAASEVDKNEDIKCKLKLIPTTTAVVSESKSYL